MAHIKHNSKEYDIPAGSTPQAAFESLKTVIPELANATLKKDGDNYKAEVSYGRKG